MACKKLQPKLTVTEVVRRLKKHKPIDWDVCEVECDLNLEYLGAGCTRRVYKVVGVPMVLKFACGPSEQATREFIACKKIMRKSQFKSLRRLTPKVYFFDRQTGVTAMKYYKDIGGKETETARDYVADKFAKVFGNESHDIHNANLCFARSGGPKLIDMGFVQLDNPIEKQRQRQRPRCRGNKK